MNYLLFFNFFLVELYCKYLTREEACKLLERIKSSTTEFNITGSDTAILNYYILISTGYKSDDGKPITIYGCEVELLYPNSTHPPEVKSVAGIFQSLNEIERFVKKLHANRVTPCTLYDLVYDYISA